MWFLEKVRSSPGEASSPGMSFLGLPSGHSVPDKSALPASGAAFNNILTPDRIPEFCIPPRLVTPPPVKSPGAAFLPHRCLTEPGLQHVAAAPDHGSGSRGGPGVFLPHLIQVESVEEVSGLEEEEEEEGGTNSDPQSQAALSLPHFPKAQTSYGFCTLLESPHTRRKESIFHSEGPVACGSSGPGLTLPRSRASSYSGRELSSTGPVGIPPLFLTRRRLGTWDSDTASSTESSPFSSPRLSPRSSSLFKTWSHDGLLGRTLKSRSGWRRPGRADSLSTEEGGSSTDSSPNATRRSSESLFDPTASLSVSPRAYSLAPLPTIFPLDLPCGRERLGRESSIALGPGALIRLSSEYCAENRRLRVRLISAEGLYPASTESKNIHCCITFSLVPGRIQKQRSTVIKRSRNPIFNEDFFFVGVTEEDLYGFSLRMKAVNKGCSMKRDLVLGESQVALMTLLTA